MKQRALRTYNAFIWHMKKIFPFSTRHSFCPYMDVLMLYELISHCAVKLPIAKYIYRVHTHVQMYAYMY